jgi:Uma2 family endonuclease
MSDTARRIHYTYEQYRALEEESTVRHEYLDGEIYALARGTPDHAALAAGVIGLLRSQLPPGCRAFTSDLRIRIPSHRSLDLPGRRRGMWPHATRGGRPARRDQPRTPKIEVTSPSTEDYDRREKLRQYRHLPSLREVLLVSHRQPRLTLHRRDADDWIALEARQGDELDLVSLAARLRVDDVYRPGLEDAET